VRPDARGMAPWQPSITTVKVSGSYTTKIVVARQRTSGKLSIATWLAFSGASLSELQGDVSPKSWRHADVPSDPRV
jgi:hypothetical protein